jgi:hypothetical protein
MKEGLLWYDNDSKRSLSVKVDQAVTRYRARFGRQPTVCYLNEVDLNGHVDEVTGIRLQPKPNVLRHHLLLGEENNVPAAKAA